MLFLTYFSLKNRDMRLTLLFTALLLIGACQKEADNQKNASSKHQENNLYKKYHVKKMNQYAQDLAFYEPNDRGRIIQTYSFNKQGQIIKVIRYDKSGNICFTEEIDPDTESGDNKLIVKESESDSLTIRNFGPEGELRDKVSYRYNDKGLKEAMIRKNKNGKVVEKITYKYYPNGLLKQDIYWNMDIEKPEQIINYEYEYY